MIKSVPLALFLSISLLFGVHPIDGATVFFANNGFTQNGIEWCEENRQLYELIGDEFFVHHNHSIESRICVNLYEDPLWNYSGPDRTEKLIERSRYFVELEIAESEEEAQTGVIDPKPAEVPSLPVQEESPEVSEDEIDTIDTETDEPTQSGGGCLIATAAFDSELSSQIQTLREVRDNVVQKTKAGSIFLDGFNQIYYSFSPTIADFERENPTFKEAVKIAITPLITSLSILSYLDIDTEEEMLGYGIGVILLNLGVYFVAPALIVTKLKKYRLFR